MQASAQRPGQPLAQLADITPLLDEPKDFPQRLKDWERALSANDAGVNLVLAGRAPDAIRPFAHAIALGPPEETAFASKAQGNMAMALFLCGDVTNAHQMALAARTQDKNNAYAWNIEANCYSHWGKALDAEGRKDEADKYFKKAQQCYARAYERRDYVNKNEKDHQKRTDDIAVLQQNLDKINQRLKERGLTPEPATAPTPASEVKVLPETAPSQKPQSTPPREAPKPQAAPKGGNSAPNEVQKNDPPKTGTPSAKPAAQQPAGAAFATVNPVTEPQNPIAEIKGSTRAKAALMQVMIQTLDELKGDFERIIRESRDLKTKKGEAYFEYAQATDKDFARKKLLPALFKRIKAIPEDVIRKEGKDEIRSALITNLTLNPVFYNGYPEGLRSRVEYVFGLFDVSIKVPPKPAPAPPKADKVKSAMTPKSVSLTSSGGKVITIEEIAASESDDILRQMEVRGDGFFGMVTPGFLKGHGLGPKHRVRMNGLTVDLSDPYLADDSRIAVVGYVEKDGHKVARTFYRSNSQGIWRYLPSYTVDQFGNIDWYHKGHGEESILLPIQLQKALAEISKDESKTITVAKPERVFAGTARRFQKGVVISMFNDVTAVPLKLHGKFYSGKRGLKVPPGEMGFDDKQEEPVLTKVLDSWTQKTQLYGDLKVEVLASRNGRFHYMFCTDKLGRTMIGGIEDMQSAMTSQGLRANWVDGGDLTTPMYEYGMKDADQTGGYGNRRLHDWPYVDMYKNYLSKIPIIQEYQRLRGIRPANELLAA